MPAKQSGYVAHGEVRASRLLNASLCGVAGDSLPCLFLGVSGAERLCLLLGGIAGNLKAPIYLPVLIVLKGETHFEFCL